MGAVVLFFEQDGGIVIRTEQDGPFQNLAVGDVMQFDLDKLRIKMVVEVKPS